MAKSLFISISIMMLAALMACDSDKIVKPEPVNLNGTWVETYPMSYTGGISIGWSGPTYFDKELTSELKIVNDSFYLNIYADQVHVHDSDWNHVGIFDHYAVRSDSGEVLVKADSLVFNPNPDTGRYTRYLTFELFDRDSLHLSTVSFTYYDSAQDVYFQTIELVGYIWGANIDGLFSGFNQKSSGMLVKSN